MILTVIGGSAHSTPVLIEALARLYPQLHLTVRLAGRDQTRLNSVERACNLLAAGTEIETQAYDEQDLGEALAGAAVVLIQARIGGYAGRAFDESFSLPHGIPGDEGLGPGGLSAGYRSWPRMHDLLRQVRSAAPLALVILLSSPGSLLIRLAALTFPGWPLVGTCELPLTTLDHLCAITGADAARVRFSYTGVNHLGFLGNVRTNASDDLLARYIAQQRNDLFPTSDLVARLGAFPLKYLRSHYEPAQVVAEQLHRTLPRADELAAIARQAFKVFSHGDAEAIRRVLLARRADWYELAILPLLLNRMGLPVDRPTFLSIADEEGDVRERAYALAEGVFQVLPASGSTLPALEALVAAFSTYEQAAAHAVLDGSAEALTFALSLHPSFSDRHARALAQAIVSQPFSRHHDGPPAASNAKNEKKEELCPI